MAISQGLRYLQTPTSWIYFKRNTPNFSQNRSGVWTKYSSRRRKHAMSLKKLKIERKLSLAAIYMYKVTHDLSIGAKIYDLE